MKKGPFKLRSGNRPSIAKLSGISPVKKDWKYLLAGPEGRKRQDAEFENKIRMEHDAPRKLPEVTVVGKKLTPPDEKKTTEKPKKWRTKFTKPVNRTKII